MTSPRAGAPARGALLLLLLCCATVANASSRSLLASENQDKAATPKAMTAQEREQHLILLALLAKMALEQSQRNQQSTRVRPGEY